MKNEAKNEERKRLGYSRIEYQNYLREYRKLQESSNKIIDADDP